MAIPGEAYGGSMLQVGWTNQSFSSNVEQGTPTLGTATLVAGSATVSYPSITASNSVFLTVQTAGGTLGFLHPVITAGTGFTITSSSSTDTSTVAYWIV